MKGQKGFTLIEVLIVVVIIAVLASLILPRCMGQSERAVIAEAQMTLGAIRRGQATWMDMTNTDSLSAITRCGSPDRANCNNTAAQWGQIGLKAPATTSKFSYACFSGNNTCAAYRQTPAPTPADYRGSTISQNVDSGNFSCGGNYTLVNAADLTKGCTTM